MNISCILDSSVIAKWFFPEEDSKKALILKEKFVNGSISIAAPVLLYYEINNLLKTAAKKFHIKNTDIEDVYQAFLKLNFTLYSSQDLMIQSLKTAVKFDISSYDASYLTLAEYLETPFIT